MEFWKTAGNWLLLGLLGIFSICDIRIKKLPVAAIVLSGAAVLLYSLCTGKNFPELAAGLVPGAVVLLCAFITKESIGTGDGLVLCVLGLYCGWKRVVGVLGMALVFAALVAAVLLVTRRAGRKTELPFLPCIFAAYLLEMIW